MNTRTNRLIWVCGFTLLSVTAAPRAWSQSPKPAGSPDMSAKANDTAKPNPPPSGVSPAAVLPSPGAPQTAAVTASAVPGTAKPSPAASGSPVPSTAATPSASKTGVTVIPGTNTAVPPGSPVIIVQAAPAAPGNGAGIVESTPNNWIGGLVGLGLLGTIGYFGFRWAKNRGMTVEDTLKKLGIETPANAQAGTPFSQLKPTPAPLPPLPSLNELPLAGPASSAGSAGTVVAAAPRTAALIGVSGPVSGERFDLDKASLPFSVGRDDMNSLALTGDSAISRRHAEIGRDGSKWTVGDLGSSNGTFLNGARVSGRQQLRPGDEIQIGGSRFRFEG